VSLEKKNSFLNSALERRRRNRMGLKSEFFTRVEAKYCEGCDKARELSNARELECLQLLTVSLSLITPVGNPL
jgi:hypothetical protein